QDPDEAAHYEFVCKAAGVPVHYCAEHFRNDQYLPHLILKALKRVMAGEYSRELSDKVFAGMVRLTQAGFRAGAVPGYGLRRLLVGSNGEPKGLLGAGEKKSISNDRVVLGPGPDNEVQCVREIFEMFTIERRSMQGIAALLNYRGTPYRSRSRWSGHAIMRILCNPKYKGTAIYNRTTSRLLSRAKRTPESEWIV